MSFFSPPSFKRWNRRCWMMDRCVGFVLFFSAPKEIIDLHYSPTHKTLCFTHIHSPSLLFYPYVCITSHIAARFLINKRMFSSFPVFYRGGVLSSASGTASPGLTWEGKLSHYNTAFTRLLKWCQNHTLPRRDYASIWLNEGYGIGLNLSHCHAWLICWL